MSSQQGKTSFQSHTAPMAKLSTLKIRVFFLKRNQIYPYINKQQKPGVVFAGFVNPTFCLSLFCLPYLSSLELEWAFLVQNSKIPNKKGVF